MDDDLQLPPTPPREPRKGGARERYQRRRERLQHVAPPTTARGRTTARQIKPPRNLKLPINLANFPLQRTRALLSIVGGAAFVVLVIIVLALLKNDEPQIDPNGLWIGTEWTYENRSNDDVLAFSRRLRDNRIGAVYAWVSLLKPDGTWSGDQNAPFSAAEASVKAFVSRFKVVYPEARLYGWVSVPTDTSGIPARLNDPEVQQTVADFAKQVVEAMGFDGVFLNVARVTNGNEDFLALLRKVRAALGDSVPLSVAIPPDWSPIGENIPVPARIEPGTVWAKEYKKSVALLADQIAIMAYNSGLENPDDYSEWMAYQVKTFAEAIGELQSGVQLIIGIPVHPAEPPLHDPLVENVSSALSGLQLGLQQAGDNAQFVRGAAIYAEWAADQTEWQAFKTDWVDQ